MRSTPVAGPRVFSRRRGEALHPAREPRAMRDEIPHTIGEYPPDTSYRGSPAGISRRRAARRRARQTRLVQALSADGIAGRVRPPRTELGHANKASKLADFSVCTSWSEHGVAAITFAAPPWSHVPTVRFDLGAGERIRALAKLVRDQQTPDESEVSAHGPRWEETIDLPFHLDLPCYHQVR
jgi:hypothetical protein